MKVAITGGTGLLGTSLTKKLVERGINCIIFTRNPNQEGLFKNDLVHYVKWTTDADKLSSMLEKVHGVINLAGAPIADRKWTREYKDTIIRSRVETTTALTEAINKCTHPPQVLLSSSATGYFGDRGDEKLYDDTNPGEDFLADVCIKWEQATQNLKKDIRLVIFRTGVVLTPDGGALEKMLTPFKMYVGGPLGKGNQFFPWISLADWENFIIFALLNETFIGKYNLTAPNPVTMKEFSKTLGKVLNRPSIFKVPGALLKVILGESSSMILNSQRVIPKRIIESDFKFTHNTVREGLEDTLKKT